MAIGQHGLFGKQNLYDHSNHVPLIFWGAGTPKNAKVDGLCYLSDIFATLADQTGVSVPSSVQGISLKPALKDPKTPLRSSLYFAYKHFQRGVKKDGFKLIEYHVNGERHTQLFDLKNDPWEINNLSDNNSSISKRDELRKELLTLQTKHSDTFSSFWNGFKF